jgi:HlyD family secretion protein
MKNKILFIVAIAGIALGLYSAYLYSQRPPAQPPVFNPAPNPYANGIYANGIVESFQSEGENINIYPEVSGPITRILVTEGQKVKKGTPLLTIDDSVQRATAEQQKSQAEAALALLDELKAQPRPETLEVAAAQVGSAKATLKSARDTLDKQERSYALDPQSVSLDVLDSARNAASVAEANLTVAQKQYDLTKAGAWSYDIQNQQKQYDALSKSYQASAALLAKYTITAPVDGIVLSIEATVGSYVSSQGAYDTYTEALGPLVTMGASQEQLEVRCYIDEILVHRLPETSKITAKMFIQGTDISIPLTFERLQPYVSPKIELSNEREERVDVRVLPLIFRFEKPKDLNLFPGQLVDVYVGQKPDSSAKSIAP